MKDGDFQHHVVVDEEEDEILSLNIEDISQVFYSDLFKDDINNIFNPSQSSSPSSCVEDPVISSWISGIEDKLFNDETTYIEEEDHDEEETGKAFCPDDFFADLDLPYFNQSLSHQEAIGEDSTRTDGVIRVLNDENCSTPQSHLSPQDEVVAAAAEDDYFSDYLIDILTDQSDQVRVLNYGNSSSPESVASEDNNNSNNNNQKETSISDKSSSDNKDIEKKKRTAADTASSEDKDEDDDHPISKKRKRQMRNRDAAVRSRERKKMHMKDLEVKTKYLEGECIRLQRILQCFAAENHALRFQLQEKAFSASRTKQESAVLLLESLLLGSLLWFLVILSLFSPLEIPRPPASVLVKVGRDNQKVVDLVALGRAQSKSIGLGTLRLFFKSKRCKASRSRMKTLSCYGAVVVA